MFHYNYLVVQDSIASVVHHRPPEADGGEVPVEGLSSNSSDASCIFGAQCKLHLPLMHRGRLWHGLADKTHIELHLNRGCIQQGSELEAAFHQQKDWFEVKRAAPGKKKSEKAT